MAALNRLRSHVGIKGRSASRAIVAIIAAAWPGTAPAQQPPQPSGEWGKLPKMILERQYAGPLQDTVIQRLRDPVDGTICYLYLPISAPHTPPAANGFVQYGSNTIGSINCMPGAAPAGRRQ